MSRIEIPVSVLKGIADDVIILRRRKLKKSRSKLFDNQRVVKTAHFKPREVFHQPKRKQCHTHQTTSGPHFATNFNTRLLSPLRCYTHLHNVDTRRGGDFFLSYWEIAIRVYTQKIFSKRNELWLAKAIFSDHGNSYANNLS